MINELEVLAKANHPNIMHVFEILHDKKFYFIVSEFIRYGELFNYIVERTKMSN
jgi:serine/threonine protein kinase